MFSNNNLAIPLEKIVYHTTSTQTKPNIVMQKEILPFFQKRGVEKALDFGCGRYLRDSLLLARNNIFVDAVELEEQIKKIEPKRSKHVGSLSESIPAKNYDAALLNFVIQVLPTPEQRTDVLESVCNSIKNGGYLVLSVRNSHDIRHFVKPKGIPFNDGYVMTKHNEHTFVKTYDRKEVESILNSLNLSTIRIFSTSDSYIALAQK